ncbi:hypothetical protein KR222_010038 [Zaprionus bogoriensis]|nr:hypothetical protein KR222_010038 [Zaprionus bogoriensis]
MPTSGHQLQPIDLQGLQRMKALYRRDWPKYRQEYHVVNTIAAFIKAESQMKHIRALTLLDQRVQDLGLFLIVDRYQLFVGCLGDSMEYLEQALQLLDWTSGLLCSTICERYIATVLKVIDDKQLTIGFHHNSNLYALLAYQPGLLPVDCPEGFQLRRLSEEDALVIDHEWPYSQEGSLYFMQRQIRLCASMGLYEEATQKLVAWCIRTQDGLLAALQVDSAYKRRGFGSLIVKALCRHISELGDDVTAEVYASNKPSVNMFTKLGFQIIGQCYWINVLPATAKFSWPEGE